MSLIDELIKQKLIDKKTAQSLEKEALSLGEKIESLILQEGLIPEEELFKIKSKQLNIPLEKFFSTKIPIEVLDSIPRESVEHYKMIPLRKKDKVLEVGMVYPEDLKAQEALNFLSRQKGFNYKVVLISLGDFRKFFSQYETLAKEVEVALEDLENQLAPKKNKVKNAGAIATKKGEAPISKTVAVILKHAVEGKASDVHIEPERKRTRIRFRLDGVLHSSLFLPAEVHSSIVARIKIISKLKIDETRIPQDGRFSVLMDGKNIDFRVSTFPTTLGEKVVMRVLDSSDRLSNFDKLGIEDNNLKIIQEAIKRPFGTILVTGPTGSGKTTTLYVVLGKINKEGVNIVTLEDPVEYFVEGISQSQVKPEIGYTFASGLRHILRQDPDVIMVGEIRDNETAELATHAALTGHIVLSTLHTNNAIGAVPRLADLGVKIFLIPPTLNIIIAQRLARRLCPYCKKKVKPNLEEKKFILDELEKFPPKIRNSYDIKDDFWTWKPVGCARCGGTGYSGRIGVFEVLKMTKQLEKIILSDLSEEKIQEEAKRQGMVTMKQDGIIKVLKGKTSLEEIIRIT